MHFFRDVLATWPTDPPTLTRLCEDINLALQQAPPFRESGDGHIWDVRRDPSEVALLHASGQDLGRHLCPQRAQLANAIIEALLLYGAGCVGLATANLNLVDHDIPKALELIGNVLSRFYPRSRNQKLHRMFDAVADRVRAIRLEDYVRRGRRVARYGAQLKRELSGRLYDAFLCYGPSPQDYPREAIYWAIATILKALAIDDGEIALLAERVRKRCLACRLPPE
jgi:hypothetical protein